MGQALAKEKRLFDREALSSLSGELKIPKTGRVLEFLPLDISPVGLGVHVYEELDVGEIVYLVTGAQTVVLKVKWCLENPGDLYGFRLGLVSVDQSYDLAELCRR